MFILSTVLILLASVILILIVLVQNSKGGGLSSSFAGGGGGSQMGGAVQTNQFLEKATWTLVVALLIFCITASISLPKAGTQQQNSVISEKVKNDFTSIPVVPDAATIKEATKKEEKKGE